MKAKFTGKLLFVFSFYCLALVQLLNAQTINTIAGTGAAGYSGDGGASTAAKVSNPRGVAADAAGNIYIADYSNDRIRKIDATYGYISTVAGNGTSGFAGDGGAATSANLNNPYAVAVNEAGDIFIGDQSNFRIRKVDHTTLKISTVAGTGLSAFNGDGALGTATNITISGLAVDNAGNIYVSSANRVRKIDATTNLVSTVAGNGYNTYSGDGGAATSAGLNYAEGIAVDAEGNLYISDASNNVVRKVTYATGIISTIAGNYTLGAGYSGDGGPATEAQLKSPRDIAVDMAGNIYIADNGNSRIRKVDAVTGIITTVVGNGVAAYSGDGGPALAAAIKLPQGIAFDNTGNLIISDGNNQRIRKVTGFCNLTAPTITAASGTSICQGASVALTSSEAAHYLWSNNDTTRSTNVSAAGNYTVKVTDANGCTAISTVTTTTLNASPTASFGLYSDNTTPHHWFVLNTNSGGTPPYTYKWSWGDGNSSTDEDASHTYAASGYYNICDTIVDANGCKAGYCSGSVYIFKNESGNEVISVDVVKSLPTGTNIEDMTEGKNVLSVYPNPCYTCEIRGAANASELIVTDVLGKKIPATFIPAQSSQNYSINLQNSVPGIYFVLDTKTGKTVKFVKE